MDPGAAYGEAEKAAIGDALEEMKDIKLLHDDMVAIACDGKVDEHEAETWDTVRQEVFEMIAAGMALMFRQKEIQKEKAPAFAVAR